MNRRAVLGLVGCGVGTAATGRAVALAGCDASGDPGAGLVARWVFPAGDYRVGIARGADLAVRLIVFATASEPERTFAIPPPAPRPPSPKGRRPAAWASVDTTADEPAQPGPAGSAMPGVPDVANGGVPEAGEARIVFDDGPGLKTTVDCCGIGIAGKAYAVASVSETGPTYLVRLDPATGRIAPSASAGTPSTSSPSIGVPGKMHCASWSPTGGTSWCGTPSADRELRRRRFRPRETTTPSRSGRVGTRRS